ncbi:hypothetical protein [Actinomadura sp. 7K507]|uniref:hypothetical protein n=1 Tax=Actinomadura sp. 7K507 TaxID=2530365 RepID=UPI00105079FD|nr:hypothetical protein [Actinomadura sp. 7K507]TDC97718.1 hypothetical protein E1285_02525 [Actinomadura sp. 7K507]
MGVEKTSGTDTRAENAEQPPSRDNPPGPPPDRPGSPGQPSRLESLRAAREAQEARRAEAQQTTAQGTNTDQRDERQEATSEPTAEKEEAPADPKETPETESADASESDERDRESGLFKPEAGETQPDGRVEPTPETNAEPDREPEDENAESSLAEPSGEKPDTPAEPQNEESQPELGESEREAEEAEPPEGRGEGLHAEEAGGNTPEPLDERDQPQQGAQAPGTDADREPATEHTTQAEDEPTHHERAPLDDPAPTPAKQQDDSAQNGQSAEGGQQRPPEDQPRTAEPPQQPDGPMRQVAWPSAAEEGVTRWTSPVVHFNDRTPSTRVQRRDTNAEGQPETPDATDPESNEYRKIPEIPRHGTPGRGELRRPEDDPEGQDLREPDPDRTRRSDRIRRQAGRQSEDAANASKKIGNKVGEFLGDRPPGPLKTSTGRDSIPDLNAPNQTMKLGNAAIGFAIGTVVLVKAGQRIYGRSKSKVSELPGRRHGSNG